MISISDKFQREFRFELLSEILIETRVLNEFKDLYIKHAFDSLGPRFREFYHTQEEFLQRLKKEYDQKYS